MAAITSMIFIGHGHPNDGGIRPQAMIQLEEGSRPNFSILLGGKALYIPTVEHMLDDLIFMIAVEVVKHPFAQELYAQNYIDKLEPTSPKREARRVEMSQNFSNHRRSNIYSHIRQISDLPKIVICNFKGSSLNSKSSDIKNYQCEYEICDSVMGRIYSNWTSSWEDWQQ